MLPSPMEVSGGNLMGSCHFDAAGALCTAELRIGLLLAGTSDHRIKPEAEVQQKVERERKTILPNWPVDKAFFFSCSEGQQTYALLDPWGTLIPK